MSLGGLFCRDLIILENNIYFYVKKEFQSSKRSFFVSITFENGAKIVIINM